VYEEDVGAPAAYDFNQFECLGGTTTVTNFRRAGFSHYAMIQKQETFL
jgi:hypothetical protein